VGSLAVYGEEEVTRRKRDFLPEIAIHRNHDE